MTQGSCVAWQVVEVPLSSQNSYRAKPNKIRMHRQVAIVLFLMETTFDVGGSDCEVGSSALKLGCSVEGLP